MSILHIADLDRALPPAVAGAVLSVAAYPTAGTQAKPDSPVITIEAPASLVEPLSTLLQFPPSDIKVSVISEAQPKRRQKGRKSMSRRSGQNGTVVIQAGWYRVRWRQDVEGQEQRQQMNEKITPVVLDKKGNPKPPSTQVRRTAREIVERSGANSKEHFDHVVLGVETFKERAKAWLREVQRRRYDKYKTGTLPTIEGALRKHLYHVIGDIPLAQVNNKSCKPLVEAMFNAGLSICSVNNYMRLVLQLVHSVKDPETGEPVHRLKWNREYLELPKIVKDEQHVPAVTAEQVDKLVSESKDDEQALYVIAAATGMRIAEILGLEARHIVNNGRTLVVEQSINRFGRLSGLKTRAAKRYVDVSNAVGDYLLSFNEGKSGLLFKTKKGTPLRAGNLRRRWLDKRLDDYGFHSFRRFRITHLEAVRAHGHLTKIWAGHSLGNDITSEYAKSLKENLSLRLAEAEKVGTGFALPAPSCSKISGAQAVAVAA
ncbi:MAG: tyrosine-type recombinase/integrase [Candidatus Acidiferrales bacterium]